MPGFAGFDRYDYPGDAVMQWLQANNAVAGLAWCGYYFGPLPEHAGTSWMGTRAKLQAAGWGLLPIYVGRQLEAGVFTATATDGDQDGAAAAKLMASQGFDAGWFVYLDIENGLPLSAPQAAYVGAWYHAVRAAGYGAGIYCSHALALAVHNLCPDARIWAFNVASTQSHPAPFPCPDPNPSGSGYVGAYAWQLGQNCRLSVPPAAMGSLDADLSSALTADPAAPAPAALPGVAVAACMMAAPAGLVAAAQTVVDACAKFWDADKHDCSGFARDVASACGVTLPADADANAITDMLGAGAAGWTMLADGVAAAAAAMAGSLVIGGLRGDAQSVPNVHGHVVVVVPGPLNRDLYPTAWWGSLGGTPFQSTTVNFAWVPADRDRVTYAAHDFGAP